MIANIAAASELSSGAATPVSFTLTAGVRSIGAPTGGQPAKQTERRLSPSTRAGQQKGSKRAKSSLRNHAQFSTGGPQARMNRAIARQSSPIVVSMEHACHAGGREFESRRSRKKFLQITNLW